MSRPSHSGSSQTSKNSIKNSTEFSSIYEEFHSPIYGYLLRMTENQADAEDLTQETFVRVHRSFSRFRGDSSLKTWLFRIANNVFLDHTRRANTRQGKLTDTLEGKIGDIEHREDEEAPQPEQIAAQSEMSACVQDYVETLPHDYKTVLVLHDEQDFKIREIAEVLGCSEATAKIRLHRAREKLRAALNTGCDFSRDERNVFVCERKEEDGSYH